MRIVNKSMTLGAGGRYLAASDAELPAARGSMPLCPGWYQIMVSVNNSGF